MTLNNNTMMHKLILTILFSCISYHIYAKRTYISGCIEHYKNMEITINYDKENIVCNNYKKSICKTDNYCQFQIIIEDLRYVSLLNWIKIGSKKIYLYLEPGDSVSFKADAKNMEDVVFIGNNRGRNMFINDYFHRAYKRKYPDNKILPDSSLKIFDSYFISDSLLLCDYLNRKIIDTSFYFFFMNILNCDYLNNLATFNLGSTSQFKIIASAFSLNNEYLKYYSFYYSAISGYAQYILNKTLDLYSVAGLKSGLIYANQILEKPYSEIYQAYMIGYIFIQPFKKKLKTNNQLKEIINNFTENCSDKILWEELMQMFKYRGIII
jgi:hypothetical protein